MSIKRNGGIVFFSFGRVSGSFSVKRPTVARRGKPSRCVVDRMRLRLVEIEKAEREISPWQAIGVFALSVVSFAASVATIL